MAVIINYMNYRMDNLRIGEIFRTKTGHHTAAEPILMHVPTYENRSILNLPTSMQLLTEYIVCK